MINLDDIRAEGNDITFGAAEFQCGRLPRKRAWQLMEQIRIQLPRVKALAVPLMAKVAVNKTLDVEEAVPVLFDLLGVLTPDFVEHVQDTIFEPIMFRTSPSGEFMAYNPMVADVAFGEMGVTDIYALMARCLWVNYKKDIMDWSAFLAERWREEAARQAAEEAAVAGATTEEVREALTNMGEMVREEMQAAAV